MTIATHPENMRNVTTILYPANCQPKQKLIIPLPRYRYRQGGSGVTVKTFDSPADFVLISGEPTNEPIVQHGPFVMNTRQVLV